jgi:hypothetical protein
MPIIGYQIISMNAEREKIQGKRFDISSTPKITSVEEREIRMGEKQKVLVIGFEFLTVYKAEGNQIGEIKIVGELLYAEKNLKNVLNFWGKKNKLPEDVDIEVKNFLFRKCLSLGIFISENLQLPPPVMFPVLIPKKESEDKTRYIG